MSSHAHHAARTLTASEIHDEVQKLLPDYKNNYTSIYEHLKKLEIKPVGVDPARRNARVYPPETVELVKLSIEDMRAGSGGRAYAPRGRGPRLVEAAAPTKAATAADAPRPLAKPTPVTIPAVPVAGAPTWQDFDSAARKLARICKVLRVTLVEIENPTNGETKIRYEQNNDGEIKL